MAELVKTKNVKLSCGYGSASLVYLSKKERKERFLPANKKFIVQWNAAVKDGKFIPSEHSSFFFFSKKEKALNF